MGFTPNNLGGIVEAWNPETSVGGAPLEDLSHAIIWMDTDSSLDVNDNDVDFKEVLRVDMPNASGGGKISEHINIPVPPGAELTVRITVSWFDHSNNESEKLIPEIWRFDKLPPAAGSWSDPNG